MVWVWAPETPYTLGIHRYSQERDVSDRPEADDSKRDEVLGRMLRTPPAPRKPPFGKAQPFRTGVDEPPDESGKPKES